MLCPKCNTVLPDNAKFCGACGCSIEQSAQTEPAYEPLVYTAPEPVIPEQYKPLSPWAFFGLKLLYAVPIVGFIFLIIHSCKKCNLSRRNFALSYWCDLIIVAVILIIFIATGASLGALLSNF